jgi:hypothetical protein
MSERERFDAIQSKLPVFPNQPDQHADIGLMIAAYGVEHVITYCERRAADHAKHIAWFNAMAAHLRGNGPDPRAGG